MDAVGDLQTALLTDVLDAVDKLTGHTFVLQLLGQLHLKGDGQVAFIGHQPARDILRDDFHIDSFDGEGLTLYLDADGALLFEFCNLLLRELVHSGGHTLHKLTELLAHRTEIALHLLHQYTGSLHETELLHVHLVHDEILDSLDMLLLFSINSRNHDGL